MNCITLMLKRITNLEGYTPFLLCDNLIIRNNLNQP
jgi:hypothetical protein